MASMSILDKLKGKVLPLYAVKENSGIAPRILNTGIRWK
jgi:hypothetical protein